MNSWVWLYGLVVATMWAALAAGEPVPGLVVLCPAEGPATAGEAAARDLATATFEGQELMVPPQGGLEPPEGTRVMWWHSERFPWPASMQMEATRKALLAWVAHGHGLLLSGTALAYVTALGLEPTTPRTTGTGGSDGVTVGVTAADAAGHPIYQSLDTSKPVLLTSVGFPPFSDFHGSGGPVAGKVIGAAYPDAGEAPLVEYGHGAGRIIVMGWRLPCYGLAGNTHREQLVDFTRRLLGYLAAGKWYGTLPDPRAHMVRARLAMVREEAVRRAVADLTQSYPEQYRRGPQYLAALNRLAQVRQALDEGAPEAVEKGERLLTELGRALLDNPLLDFDSLLVIKRSPGQLGLPQNWESNSSLPQRGYDNELCVLSPVSPQGELRTLFRPPGGEFVGDVDLDFGGDRLLFSMPGSNGRWQVYEMRVDGSGLTELPLIHEPDVDNYDACYLPDGNLVFTSTAPFVGVPCVTGSAHVSNLFRWDRGSGAIRQLTFDQDHDWCPTVLPNGRVLYLRWEYSDLPHFVSRILFSMNPDGTGQAEFYGSNSYWPNALFYAQPIPGSNTRFVGVVGGHHDHPRMGELVLFDRARGRFEADGVVQRIPGFGQRVEPIILDGLTAGSWPKFLHPYPLSDKYFLVSCKPTPGAAWGIYLADVFDNLTLIKEIPGYALLEPVPLRPTPRPPVLASSVTPGRKDAVVYLADVYAGQGLAGVPRGTVKALRLFTYHFAYHNVGGQANRVGLDGPWDIKRVLGTVPVERDGSALFRVPANTPISVQPLDETGQALQLMRSWMTAMPGEFLSCVGCHEQQSESPPVAGRLAARRAPSEIRPWYGPVRGFSFVREVQPVLDRHCVSCHNGSPGQDGQMLPDFTDRPLAPPPGPQTSYQSGSRFTPSYLALKQYVRGATIESDMHVLMPGEFAADTTRLVQMLRAGHHSVALGAEDWDRLITWIDLNTPAHGTWHEIVGMDLIRHPWQRRREMMARYAGRDEDPEAILPVTYTPPEPREPRVHTPAAQSPACPGWPFDAKEARRRQAAAGGETRTLEPAEGVRLELVRIPAGQFVCGDVTEGSARVVHIPRAFWMGRCEVTNAQFRCFRPSHDSRHEVGDFLQFSEQERGYSVNDPEQPVCRVAQTAAVAFCRWLSERTGVRCGLPTQEQWEWACRAGTDTPLWFGGPETDFASYANLADLSLRRVDNFAPWALPWGAIYEWRPAVATVNDGYRVSAPVGSFRPNPWGLYDMHGNVAEWTSTPAGEATGHATDCYIVRGGSWYDLPSRARSASWQAYPAYRGVYDVGFRVVAEDK